MSVFARSLQLLLAVIPAASGARAGHGSSALRPEGDAALLAAPGGRNPTAPAVAGRPRHMQAPLDGEIQQHIAGMSSDLQQILLSYVPGPPQLALASGGNNMTLWRRNRLRQLRLPEPVRDLTFSPSGERLLSLDSDHILTVWDTASGNQSLEFFAPGITYIFDSAFFPDNDRVASVGANGTIVVWSSVSGQILQSFDYRGIAIEQQVVRVLPCSRYIVTGVSNDNGTGDPAIVWDLEEGRLLHTLWNPGAPIKSLDLSPCGTMLAMGSTAGIFVFELPSGELLHELGGHGPMPWKVAISRGGALIAGLQSGTVFVWNAISGTRGGEPWTLPVQRNIVAFSLIDSGAGIAAIDVSGEASVWSAATGERMRHLGEGMEGFPADVAASQTGALAACSVLHRTEPSGVEGLLMSEARVLSYLWDISSGDTLYEAEDGMPDTAPHRGPWIAEEPTPCRVAVAPSGSMLSWLSEEVR